MNGLLFAGLVVWTLALVSYVIFADSVKFDCKRNGKPIPYWTYPATAILFLVGSGAMLVTAFLFIYPIYSLIIYLID